MWSEIHIEIEKYKNQVENVQKKYVRQMYNIYSCALIYLYIYMLRYLMTYLSRDKTTIEPSSLSSLLELGTWVETMKPFSFMLRFYIWKKKKKNLFQCFNSFIYKMWLFIKQLV